MKYFSVLVVLTLILAIVDQSDAFINLLDKVEDALHTGAQAGFKLIRPVERGATPKKSEKPEK
uniref:Andropin n=1 Tax=Drosophila teissieri TaxID=7243 RepID=ANDP_DROTE|nr:RecName: Full=Andropin; Flags: Precursor [Drosophila teissieri]BAB78549.1 andropin [Drosophila teissieri]